MNYQVRVYTAPTVEPVTLAEVKIDLRVDHGNDDNLLTTLIVAARQRAEELSSRSFVNRTLDLRLAAWPSGVTIELKFPPLVSVTSITYYDEDNVVGTVSASDYIVVNDVEPGLIQLTPTASWPSTVLRRSWPITVRYVAGYGAAAANTPEHYKQLIRALVAHRYEFRDEISPQGAEQIRRVESALAWGMPLI